MSYVFEGSLMVPLLTFIAHLYMDVHVVYAPLGLWFSGGYFFSSLDVAFSGPEES